MLNKIYKTSLLIAVSVLPFISYAASESEALKDTTKIFTGVKGIVVDILVPLAFTLALVFFFYGVAKYIWSEGTGKAEGEQIMIWGVVGLFVMSSVWGLVSFLQKELLIDDTKTEGKIPTIK